MDQMRGQQHTSLTACLHSHGSKCVDSHNRPHSNRPHTDLRAGIATIDDYAPSFRFQGVALERIQGIAELCMCLERAYNGTQGWDRLAVGGSLFPCGQGSLRRAV